MSGHDGRAPMLERRTQPAAAGIPRWLPNLITVLRILLIPTFVWTAGWARAVVAEGSSATGPRILVVVVLLALGGSDLLDGWLARRFGLTTQTGAVLDAIADKLAQLVLLAFFTVASGSPFGRLPPWLLGVALVRDALLGGGWLASVLRGRPVAVVHRAHGKASSALVFAVLLGATVGADDRLLAAVSAAVAGLVVISTVRYVSEGLARRAGRGP